MLSPTLFLPYLLLALVVTAVAARRANTPSRKRWITIGLLAFFFAFAHIDDILGGIQHKWLCNKEAGFFVYKTAKLPRELYDASGKPRFMTDRGPDKKMLEPYLVFDWKIDRDYRRTFLKIDKSVNRVSDRHSGQVIGESITFLAWPAEFIPAISHISADRCVEGPEEEEQWRSWYSKLFIPK